MADTTRLPDGGLFLTPRNSVLPASGIVGAMFLDPSTNQLVRWDGASWVPLSMPGMVVHKIRRQLSDMPAAATTGNVSFGFTIPARTMIYGAAVFANSAVNVGASGITQVNVSLAVNVANLVTTLNLVGVAAGAWCNPFTHATDFVGTPIITTAASQPVIVVASDGPNLNLLTALDFTAFVLASNTVLTVP